MVEHCGTLWYWKPHKLHCSTLHRLFWYPGVKKKIITEKYSRLAEDKQNSGTKNILKENKSNVLGGLLMSCENGWSCTERLVVVVLLIRSWQLLMSYTEYNGSKL